MSFAQTVLAIFIAIMFSAPMVWIVLFNLNNTAKDNPHKAQDQAFLVSLGYAVLFAIIVLTSK